MLLIPEAQDVEYMEYISYNFLNLCRNQQRRLFIPIHLLLSIVLKNESQTRALHHKEPRTRFNLNAKTATRE